jgi:hypothetical protein
MKQGLEFNQNKFHTMHVLNIFNQQHTLKVSQQNLIYNFSTYFQIHMNFLTYIPSETFWYLISLSIQKHLSFQLMDVMTVYLYESLNSDIYIKVSDGISILNANVSSSTSHYMTWNCMEECDITDWKSSFQTKTTLIMMIVLTPSFANSQPHFVLFQHISMI